MTEPKTCHDLDQGSSLSGICDGCVHVRPHEADRPPIAPNVTYLVLVVEPDVVPISDRLPTFLAEVSDRRTVRVLVPSALSDAVGDAWPTVGTTIDNRAGLRGTLSTPLDDRARVVYISPYALAEELLTPLRRTIERCHQTTFVMAGMAGPFWRFASLAARQFHNVFLDTAALTTRRLRSIFADRYQFAHLLNGLQDKIIFASGYPVTEPQWLLKALTPWFASDRARNAVLRENALRIYFH